MKIWKLVSGILSMILCWWVLYQSNATRILNNLENNYNDKSDIGGFSVAIGLYVGGILAAVLWEKKTVFADSALIVVFGLTALVGFTHLGVFDDLVFWSSWAAFCAFMASISLFLNAKTKVAESIESNESYPVDNVAYCKCPYCHAYIDINSAFCNSCGSKLPEHSFCSNCGSYLEFEASFCPNCGARKG